MPDLYVSAPGTYVAIMPMEELPDLATLSLAEIMRLVEERRLPPVDKWNPTHCGDSDMRIARDGTWYHQGSPIGRETMVRLFSSILRREADGSYVLVTPVEKLDVVVEDVPFVAVEMKAAGDGVSATLTFRLNTGDLVTADCDHPLRLVAGENGPRPYLGVRGGMEAVIARSVYYDMAERAAPDAGGVSGVWSAGTFFPLEPVA